MIIDIETPRKYREYFGNVDRTNWPDGTWKYESDFEMWSYGNSELACMMVRQDRGFWCGYVGFDKTHPCFGEHHYEIDFDVHGGITHSGFFIDKETWWLGFSCNQLGDLLPHFDKYREVGDVYRDERWVRREVEGLAWLLSKQVPLKQEKESKEYLVEVWDEIAEIPNNKNHPAQELIDALVGEYVKTYNQFNAPEKELSGFFDAHDAAYSWLEDIVQEAVEKAERDLK